MAPRVLLVEDEFLIRAMLTEALEDAGFGVSPAADGDAAARMIEVSGSFDILVTDIQMPGGIDGITLGRQIRRKHPGIPIIYTTGRPEALKDVARLGPREAYVEKPYGPSEIVGVATRLLREREREGDAPG